MMTLTDSDRQILKGTRIAILGFGAQGEAEVTNLLRSEIKFVLGIRADGNSAKKAKEANIPFVSIEEAVQNADTIVMNLSDQSQKEIYEKYIRGKKQIKRLIFAHGFNTHFKLIPVEESGPAHILVAPKGAASGLKEFYGTSSALPGILSVRPKSKEAAEKSFAEAYARAVGCHSNGLIWADFKDETECDLFSEQALLCGGVSSLLRMTYDLMVEEGYNSETAYFESLFELKLIVDLIWREGITGMRNRISPTARYGDITRGDRIIDESVKNKMREVLKEVQSGKFAKEFLENLDSDQYKQLAEKQSQHPIEVMGKKLRERLS
ncbi:MAG: Ketol-acid reductoisomerase [Bacteriovoracaceae bacterium]|nr:Ketol-acid reductoisomerase [Bacteriovoracaceae bacterium]